MSAQIAIEYPGKRVEVYFQDEARFGHAVGMLSPYINVEVINIFLELFAKEIPKDAYVVMVRNQAATTPAKTAVQNRCRVGGVYLPILGVVADLPARSRSVNHFRMTL